LSCI
jgi:hypothetical protein